MYLNKLLDRRVHSYGPVLLAATLFASLISAEAWATAPYVDLNVKNDCLAAGNGTTDDTTAIQSCITTASTSGQAIYFPAGTYKITAALTISSNNMTLYGTNNATATIVQNTSSANIFTISNGGSPINKVILKGLELYYSTQNPSGMSIYCNTCWRTYFQQLSLGKSGALPGSQHYISTGIWATGGNQVFVEDSRFNYTSSQAMYFSGVGDVYLSNLEVNEYDSDTNTTGVVFDSGVGGIYATNVNVTGGETGFLFENIQTGGVAPNYGFFTNCLGDTVNGVGWDFEAATSMRLTNSWGASAGVNGILVKNVHGLSITDSRIYNNGAAGISLNSGATDVTIKDSTIAGNARLSNGNYPGITIAAGVGRFQILNNDIGANDAFSNTQSYGIVIATGASDNYMIIGNNLQNNGTGEMSNGATGTHFVVTNNL